MNGGVARRNIPPRIRNVISGESAGNDGAAYLIVLLPVMMVSYTSVEALTRWSTDILLQIIGGAILVGLVLGTAAGHLLRWAKAAASELAINEKTSISEAKDFRPSVSIASLMAMLSP